MCEVAGSMVASHSSSQTLTGRTPHLHSCLLQSWRICRIEAPLARRSFPREVDYNGRKLVDTLARLRNSKHMGSASNKSEESSSKYSVYLYSTHTMRLRLHRIGRDLHTPLYISVFASFSPLSQLANFIITHVAMAHKVHDE